MQRTGRRILINTSALASSSLWRIATSFALQLVIARALGVTGLGQYTIALAYLNVCQILTELGLPAMLVRDLAQMPWLRRSYYYRALSIQIVASLLVWGGLIAVTALLPLPPATRMILWIVGASLPFYAITSATQTLFQAGERMEVVMGIEVLINTAILGISLGVIQWGGTTYHLAMVLVITQLISAILGVILLARSQLLAEPQTQVAWQWSMLWRRSGPFYVLALADVLLQRADIVLLSIVAGESVTGLYGAAYNLVRVAFKLVQNFWGALYPTLSRLHHQVPVHYRRLGNFSLRYGLLTLLAAAAIGAGVAQDVLHLIYGANYAEAVLVLQILLWSAPIYLLENFAQTLLMIEQRPLQSLLITGLHLGVLVLLLPLLATALAAPGAAWAALIAGGMGGLSSLYLLRRWRMPGAITYPWLVLLLSGGTCLLALWLPVTWPWRILLCSLLYLLAAWSTRLVTPQDWQLVRRVVLNKEL
ncbi:MAG: flippase [Caldilineaceae bacterium]